MSRSIRVLAVLAIIAACFVPRAVGALQANNTWTVIFDDPGQTGTQTTTITVSYFDSHTVKRQKEISATVSIAPTDSAETKKTKVQNALNAALSDSANTVGGSPLASTSGSGGVMTATPSPNTSSFTGAKIEDVETEDEETGEKDKIIDPKGKGLAQVSFEGELIGETRTNGPSVFEVATNLGTATVALSPGMTRLQVLKSLREQLGAMGPKVVTWIDSERQVLLVLMGDESIQAIGAGSTDEGLHAVCKVIATD